MPARGGSLAIRLPRVATLSPTALLLERGDPTFQFERLNRLPFGLQDGSYGLSFVGRDAARINCFGHSTDSGDDVYGGAQNIAYRERRVTLTMPIPSREAIE
jgi:phosphoribosyl 1,2-cyclic phosphodiesterase